MQLFRQQPKEIVQTSNSLCKDKTYDVLVSLNILTDRPNRSSNRSDLQTGDPSISILDRWLCWIGWLELNDFNLVDEYCIVY